MLPPLPTDDRCQPRRRSRAPASRPQRPAPAPAPAGCRPESGRTPDSLAPEPAGRPAITLHLPAQIRFGAGCAGDCGRLLAARGCRQALWISSVSVIPRTRALVAAVRDAGVTVTPATPVPAEPDTGALEPILAQARRTPFDCVIGCGGGSVLDVAKLVAALRTNSAPVESYFGRDPLPARATFLVCLPTTAGSGSEVSSNALLRAGADGAKKAVISPWLVPDVALVDPVLSATQPPLLTAATGLDALTHCIEAYTNRFAHPMVDLWALEGVRLISQHLLRAVRHGDDLAARSAVALGSLYGGLCLGPVNTAAVHALAYPLAAAFGLPHGLSNALLLAPVMRFNLAAAARRSAAVAVALGAGPAGDDLTTAHRGVAAVEALADACGLPRGLAAVGVTESAIPGLAAAALQVTRLLQNNPRPLTVRDAAQIYHDAFRP